MVHTRDVAAGWDDYSDDYEEESLDAVRKILRRGPIAVTEPLLSVRDVAELILERLRNRPVDPSKLQVLCYLVQGRHLAVTGAPAFGDKIYASPHGPFIDDLATAGSDFSRIRGEPRLAEKEQVLDSVVTEVVERYGSWFGGQLRELARNQAPWIQARQNETSQGAVIAPALMRNYFAYMASIPFDPMD
jgi:uncharacterized phage-associated protein